MKIYRFNNEYVLAETLEDAVERVERDGAGDIVSYDVDVVKDGSVDGLREDFFRTGECFFTETGLNILRFGSVDGDSCPSDGCGIPPIMCDADGGYDVLVDNDDRKRSNVCEILHVSEGNVMKKWIRTIWHYSYGKMKVAFIDENGNDEIRDANDLNAVELTAASNELKRLIG